MATCRKHPDMEKDLALAREENERLREKNRRTAAALDRYGRHLRGCRFMRTHARLRCSCGYHERLKEGGINP